MLKEFLPSLKEKPLKRKLNSGEELNELIESSSLNLLSSSTEPSRHFTAADIYLEEKFINFLKGTIGTVSIIFGMMLLFNYYLDFRLNDLKKEVDDFKQKTALYSTEVEAAKRINNKINLYKQITSERDSYGEEITFLIKSIDPSITVSAFVLEGNKFSLEMEGPNPLIFAKLLSDYLSGNYIEEIVLKSVELQNRTRTYQVMLEGHLR